MTLTLTLREQPDVPLEADVLVPDRLAGASREEIEALPRLARQRAHARGRVLRGLRRAATTSAWRAT